MEINSYLMLYFQAVIEVFLETTMNYTSLGRQMKTNETNENQYSPNQTKRHPLVKRGHVVTLQ